ncbi:MAG: DoxX family membrane protein [Pseudolabrys sp.]
MMQYLTSGVDLAAIALLINRIALGAFFTISGFHKLFNRQRHAVFVRELVVDRVPRLGFNQWFVPSVEFSGGLALLTGMLAPLAALGLLVICLVAVHTSGKRRVVSYLPIDRADFVGDVLYLPEVLYLVMLVVVVLAGPGPLRLDSVVLGAL